MNTTTAGALTQKKIKAIFKQAAKDASNPRLLKACVVQACGEWGTEDAINTMQDIAKHGISGGFGGFIYYSDTCAFYKKHRKAINEAVFQMASEFGEGACEMVGAFNCVQAYDHKTQRWTDTEDRDAIGRCLYGGRLNDSTKMIENALAWFAGEEAARLISDIAYEFEND